MMNAKIAAKVAQITEKHAEIDELWQAIEEILRDQLPPPQKRGKGRKPEQTTVLELAAELGISPVAPDGPEKRVRGRPPTPFKMKIAPDETAAPFKKRGRGRPSKATIAAATSAAESMALELEREVREQPTKRGRGRPPTPAKVEDDPDEEEPPSKRRRKVNSKTVAGVPLKSALKMAQPSKKRGRGRPAKASIQPEPKTPEVTPYDSADEEDEAELEMTEVPKKRGRGRPSKAVVHAIGVLPNPFDVKPEGAVKKSGRGRPKKAVKGADSTKNNALTGGESTDWLKGVKA